MKTHSFDKNLNRQSFNHFMHLLRYFLKVSLCIMIIVPGSFIFTESLYCQLSGIPDTGTGNIPAGVELIPAGAGLTPAGAGPMPIRAELTPTGAGRIPTGAGYFSTWAKRIPTRAGNNIPPPDPVWNTSDITAPQNSIKVIDPQTFFSQEFDPSDQNQPVLPFDTNGFFRTRMRDARQRTTASDILKSLDDPDLLRIYVKWDAPGVANGSSWATAYKSIQEAIDSAPPGRPVEIWVARGTYKENITIKRGSIYLYGGFSGTEEDSLDGRYSDLNVTILNGNANAPVIFTKGEGDIQLEDILIDGFRITNGGIKDIKIEGEQYSLGGGIFCYKSSLVIRNNDIAKNASNHGGGIYCLKSSLIGIMDNQITSNSAYGNGGGIACNESNNITISGNTMGMNYAHAQGGGIGCYNSSHCLIGINTIMNNYGGSGGGIHCQDSSWVIVDNNIISLNRVDQNNGGGIYCRDSSLLIKDNHISYNYAYDGQGGGIGCQTSKAFIIKNTITKNIAKWGGSV